MKLKIGKIIKWLNKYEWVLLLLVVGIVIRIPSWFEPHYYGDEEIYFVMGRAWKQGWLLYRDIFDHKPPLIYIFAGLFNTVFWFRMILTVWMSVHTVLFWLLARKIFRKGRRGLAFISTLIFVVLNGAPFLEGQIPNGELFMMMPVTAAALLMWDAKKGQYFRYLVAGILAGVGLLFKVPVVTDFMAFVLFFWFFREKTFLKSIKNFLAPEMWLTVVGFLLPVGLSIAYYAGKGILGDYVSTALLVNFGYVSSWQTSSYTFNPLASGLMVRGMMLAGYTLLLFLIRKRIRKEFLFAALWFGYSLFGALLSGRPYPHYLLQPAVPAALLIPFIFLLDTVVEWAVVAIIVAGSVMTQSSIGFWRYPTQPYFQNYIDKVSGKISEEEYRLRYDGTKRNYEMGEYLDERLMNGDQIYIWGSDPTVYNLTKTLPAGGKYIVSFHVRDLQAYDEVMDNLLKNKPRFVLVGPDPIEFPKFTRWLQAEYLEIKTVEGATLYLRN